MIILLIFLSIFLKIFLSELLDWTQKCSEQINLPCDLFPSSSSSLPSASEEAAEEALRRNSELREQIDGKQFEFGYVEELGQRLIEKGYPKEQVKQKLEELEHAKNELEFQWQKREVLIFLLKLIFY